MRWSFNRRTLGLRIHKLTGNLGNCWSFCVDHDRRVVFMFLKGRIKVYLIDIGAHEEVY